MTCIEMASELSFVNAHTHIELTALGGVLPEGLRFSEWLAALVEARQRLSQTEIRDGIEWAIEAMLTSGTTVVGDVTSTI
jgi:cytosine/adenosine deaminase-related metal-dependent hydrolase